MKFPRNDKRKIKASVELTPLIDVVFQLLIFFMLSSTFVVQTSIPIEVPRAEGAARFEHEQLSITLEFGEGGPDDGGRVHVNDIEIATWTELSRALSEFQRNQPDSPVLIRPDRRVETGRTIQVLGLVTSVGIQKYYVEAESPGAPE